MNALNKSLYPLGWMTLVFLCCAASGNTGMKPTDARLQEAQSAFDESKKFKQAGKYAEAIAKAEHELRMRETLLGSTHLEVSASLDQMGDLYRWQGDFARAEPLLQRALAIREAALDKHHPLLGDSFHNLACLYRKQGFLTGRSDYRPPLSASLPQRWSPAHPPKF